MITLIYIFGRLEFHGDLEDSEKKNKNKTYVKEMEVTEQTQTIDDLLKISVSSVIDLNLSLHVMQWIKLRNKRSRTQSL